MARPCLSLHRPAVPAPASHRSWRQAGAPLWLAALRQHTQLSLLAAALAVHAPLAGYPALRPPSWREWLCVRRQPGGGPSWASEPAVSLLSRRASAPALARAARSTRGGRSVHCGRAARRGWHPQPQRPRRRRLALRVLARKVPQVPAGPYLPTPRRTLGHLAPVSCGAVLPSYHRGLTDRLHLHARKASQLDQQATSSTQRADSPYGLAEGQVRQLRQWRRRGSVEALGEGACHAPLLSCRVNSAAWLLENRAARVVDVRDAMLHWDRLRAWLVQAGADVSRVATPSNVMQARRAPAAGCGS